MSESSEDESSAVGSPITTATTVTLTSSSNISASNVIGTKQKSLFAGMGRVRHINHLREKWSGKPKAMPPIHAMDSTSLASSSSSAVAASPSSSYSSSTMMALRKVKKLHGSTKVPNGSGGSGSESDREPLDFDKRRRRALSSMDMERYHTLSLWLEQNGIDIPQQHTHRRLPKALSGSVNSDAAPSAGAFSPTGAFHHSSAGKADLFDDVYESLEVLEKAMETEISRLDTSHQPPEQQENQIEAVKVATTIKTQQSLVDYLMVIGPDVTDIAIQNYWRNEENVFEATVAFAWPPESQFNAESIEHFCFPSGVSVVHANAESVTAATTSANLEGDSFFVLVLSGGGAQGQSVQYSSCMKGWMTLPVLNSKVGGEMMKVPVCYCLISEMPFIPFFKELLARLLDDHRRDLELVENLHSLSSILSNHHAYTIDDVLHKLKETSLPAKGCAVPVHLFLPHDNPMNLCRPSDEIGADEKNTLLLQWALPYLLTSLSINQILRIVGLLLLEMKVIVVSKNLTLFSSVTLGIASLLHPLKWAGPLITVLPPFLHEYLEAPVPLICGIDHLSSGFEYTTGTVVVHLEKDEIRMHDEDIQALAGRNLPGFDKLSESLLVLTKQSRTGDASASSRFRTTHFAATVVMRRVRLHIEYLLGVCNDNLNPQAEDNQKEGELLRMFTRSQMYQKFEDDSQGAKVEVARHEEILVSQEAALSPPLPLSIIKKHRVPLCDWKAAAGVLFRIAMTGVNVMNDETGESSKSSNNLTDSDAKNDSPALDDDGCDENGRRDYIDLLPTELLTMPGRTNSSQSSEWSFVMDSDWIAVINVHTFLFLVLVKSTSSRRTNHDLDLQLHPSPSGSSTCDSQSEQRYFSLGRHIEDNTLVDAQHQFLHHQSSRKGEFGVSQSNSPTSALSEEQIESSVSKTSPRDSSFRWRNNAEFVNYDGNLGISIDSQRADTDTTISVLGTFVNDVPTGSPESDVSWFSDCSSVDGKETTDSNDQESPSYRAGFETQYNGTALVSEDDDFDMEDERIADIKNLTRASSSRKIQRSWRQWKRTKQQKSTSVVKDDSPAVNAESDRTQSSTFHEHPDQSFLTAGVYVQNQNKTGEWSGYRLFLAAGLSCISWESYESGRRYSLSSLGISDLTHVVFQASGFSESRRGEFAVLELHCDNKRSCFQYELTPEHVRFVSTLYRLVYSIATIRELESAFPNQEVRQVEAPTTVSDSAKPSELKVNESFSSSAENDCLLGPRELEKFKLRLQEGFLVEKHGRIGKPHVRMLFTDVLCSRIMWKKPSQETNANTTASGYERASAPAERRKTSSSFFQKCLHLSNVTGVVEGKQTRVFKRSVARRSADSHCISIVTPTRTLDFRALSQEDFDTLYQGLTGLINEIGDMCTSLS